LYKAGVFLFKFFPKQGGKAADFVNQKKY